MFHLLILGALSLIQTTVFGASWTEPTAGAGFAAGVLDRNNPLGSDNSVLDELTSGMVASG